MVLDQLRSSLRDVADALSLTVRAVRSTTDHMQATNSALNSSTAEGERDEETAMEGQEVEEGEGGGEGEDQVSVSLAESSSGQSQATTTPLESLLLSAPSTTTNNTVTLSSPPPHTTLTQATSTTITATPSSQQPLASSSSANPILATFDGSQESAVATLASTDPEDPLYLYLSAVAGVPAPPLSESTSQTSPASALHTSQAVTSPRLPVFTQFQNEQQSRSHSQSATAIPTPVIQDSRTHTTTTPADANSAMATALPGQPPQDDDDDRSQRDLASEIATETSELASQVSSFFSERIQPSFPTASSVSEASSSLVDSTTLASNLARELSDAVSQLVPTIGHPQAGATDAVSVATSSQLVPTIMTPATMATASSSGGNQSLQSPSPSDTLAPLLISSLQMPETVSGSRPDSETSAPASEGQAASGQTDDSTAEMELSISGAETTQTSQSGSVGTSQTSLSGAEAGSSTDAATSSAETIETSQTGLLPTLSTPSQSSSAEAPTTTTSGGAESEPAIDPAFLAALPDSIRQEVISQQEREQRMLRARREAATFSSTISPEFLSALPSNIQEEVRECVA